MMSKQKLTKILKWSGAGLLVIGLVLTYVSITYAQGDTADKSGYGGFNFWAGLGVAFVGLLAKFFGIIGEVVAGIVMPIVMQVLDTLLSDPNWVFSDNSPLKDIVTTAHGAALTLANGFLLLGLVVASAAIILRIGTGTYNIKKFLGSFVTMAILANVSLPLFNALLGMGDALFNSVDFLFVRPIGISRDIILNYLQDLSGTHIPLALGVAGTILVLATILISAWVMIKVALLLIERTIFLFIMLVLAPLSFGMSVLPTTQKMASQWLENVIKWVLALPMTYAILALGVFVLQEIGGKGVTPGELSSFITKLGTSIDVVGGGGIELSASVKDLLMFIIGLTIIYMAGTVPKMLKIGGSITGLVESPGKLTGMGQKAWKSIADTATGKNLPGKLGKNALSGAYREAMSGWHDNKPIIGPAAKALRRFEGWRSSLAKEPYSAILNPQGRKAKASADENRLRQYEIFGQDVNKVRRILKPFDDAAKAKHNKNWYELDKAEQNQLKKYKPELKAASSDLSDAYSTMMNRTRKFNKDIDIADYDPVPFMEQDLIDDATDPDKSKRGEGVDMALRLAKIASSRLHPENKEARDALWRQRQLLHDAYGINIKKLMKGDVNAIPGKDSSVTEDEDDFAGGLNEGIVAGDAGTEWDVSLARTQAKAQAQHAKYDQLTQTELNLTSAEAATISQSDNISKLKLTDAQAELIKQLDNNTLSALISSSDGEAILNDLLDTDPTRQTIGRRQIQREIPNVSDVQVDALVQVAQQTGLSLGEISVAKKLTQSRRGGLSLEETTDTLEDEVGQLQQIDSDMEEIRTKIGTIDIATEQTYRQQVDVLVRQRLTRKINPAANIEVARQELNIEAADTYDSLISELSQHANEIESGATVGQIIKGSTLEKLDEFMQNSGPIGVGFTGDNLRNATLDGTLSRIRRLRDYTQNPPATNT